MKKHLIAVGIGIVIIAILIFVKDASFGGDGGMQASGCTVTETTATVGKDLAGTILSANGRRAWARVQMPSAATNTVYVSFGGTSSVGTGVVLGNQGATTTTNYIDFGRNTDFPYVGAVTGMSSVGTSTVLVAECKY